MSAISISRPVDFVVIPSLAKFAQSFAQPAANAAAPRKSAGLSFADISDASMRATTKGGLRLWPNANRAIRGPVIL